MCGNNMGTYYKYEYLKFIYIGTGVVVIFAVLYLMKIL
jgi:hypothetical protein